jgi:hypothetical protein
MIDLYRKLAGMILLQNHVNEIRSTMGDIQLGVGTSCGAEKIVHTVQNFILTKPTEDAILIDFRNAFNTVSREIILQAIKIQLPNMYPFVSTIYDASPNLWFKSPPTPNQPPTVSSILSAEGAQQGDPLGPLLFALAVMPLLKDLDRALGGIVRAYLDDTTLLGQFVFQTNSLTLLSNECQKYGLSVNYKKFHILMGSRPTLEDALADQQAYALLCPGIPTTNIKIHPDNLPSSSSLYGFVVLGTPVGTDEFVISYLANFVSSTLVSDINRLDKVTQLHSLWTYFSYVVNQKITHLLRAIPPRLTASLVKSFELIQLKLFNRVTCLDLLSEGDCEPLPLTDLQLRQLRLSTSCGGFNLRYLTDVSNAAFLASMTTSYPSLISSFPDFSTSVLYRDYEESYAYWKSNSTFPTTTPSSISSNSPTRPTTEPPILPLQNFSTWLISLTQTIQFLRPRLQRYFTSTILTTRLHQFRALLLESNNTNAIVRYQSLDQSITGAILRTWPKNEWRVYNNAFAISCRFRLGLAVFPSLLDTPQLCRCQPHSPPSVDPYGNHLCCCKLGGEVTNRHNQLITCLRDLAKLGGITSSESYLHRSVPGTSEVADFVLFRPNFSSSDEGCDYVYDPSIVHPNGHDSISYRTQPSKGFKTVSATKNKKYKSACAQLGRKFFPLPAYTYGNISPELKDLASNLALKIQDHLNWPHSVAVNHVSCSISTTMARAHANLLISRYFYLDAARREAFQNPSFTNLGPFHEAPLPSILDNNDSTEIANEQTPTPTSAPAAIYNIVDCVTDDMLGSPFHI